jgi:hypothetical protein
MARLHGSPIETTWERQGQNARLLRPGDPTQLALALWTSMHGLAVLFTEGQLGRYDRPIEAVKITGLVSGLLLEGLLARTPPDVRAVQSGSLCHAPEARPFRCEIESIVTRPK